MMIASEPPWCLLPDELILTERDVHVWCATLGVSQRCVDILSQTLSDGERARADRFYFERDRRRYIAARGILRNILGKYLDILPGQVQFSYQKRGKPYLTEGLGDLAIRFNLAHSHEIALYAFTRNRDVGVDLEYIRAIPDVEQVSARFFSATESAVLRRLPSRERLSAFFACWTRKEAYIKAIGDGLAQPLTQFDVSLAPGEPASLLHVEGKPEEPGRWLLMALDAGPRYAAALAVEGHHWRLSSLAWPTC